MTMAQVLDTTRCCIAARQHLLLGVVNAGKVVNARRDPDLKRSLMQADLILADGTSVVWLSRMLGSPLPERVAGIDLMCELLKAADREHYRIYFLGAKLDVLEKMLETIKANYPGIMIAGYMHGYFDSSQELAVIDQIRKSNADILFVAMSSPKKEHFLARWHRLLNVPVCHGVGGSFDVLAGITKRAPVWMQRYGLEWFYRTIQEPGRMWKRYLVTNTIFITASFNAILRTRLNRLFG